jgi:SLOG in TRPM, prokaryote
MSGPAIVRVTSGALHQSTAVEQLVHDVRRQADAFVFLSGGAAGMAQPVRRRARTLLDALPTLVTRGLRIAVGDGGTGAGLMKEAGLARRRGGNAFPLIGVAPAPEITGASPWGVDPNHSHLVAVDHPQATAASGVRRPTRCSSSSIGWRSSVPQWRW